MDQNPKGHCGPPGWGLWEISPNVSSGSQTVVQILEPAKPLALPIPHGRPISHAEEGTEVCPPSSSTSYWDALMGSPKAITDLLSNPLPASLLQSAIRSCLTSKTGSNVTPSTDQRSEVSAAERREECGSIWKGNLESREMHQRVSTLKPSKKQNPLRHRTLKTFSVSIFKFLLIANDSKTQRSVWANCGWTWRF